MSCRYERPCKYILAVQADILFLNKLLFAQFRIEGLQNFLVINAKKVDVMWIKWYTIFVRNVNG